MESELIACGGYDALSVLLCGGPLSLAVFLAPLLTFLCLFTTLGNTLHRALRGRPLRTVYRFDLRSLAVLVSFAAFSFAWLKALEQHEIFLFEAYYGYSIRYVPPPLPEQYLGNWMLIAIPVSIFIAGARYAIELYDDSRRPKIAPTPPSTWNFIPPLAPRKIVSGE